MKLLSNQIKIEKHLRMKNQVILEVILKIIINNMFNIKYADFYFLKL